MATKKKFAFVEWYDILILASCNIILSYLKEGTNSDLFCDDLLKFRIKLYHSDIFLLLLKTK